MYDIALKSFSLDKNALYGYVYLGTSFFNHFPTSTSRLLIDLELTENSFQRLFSMSKVLFQAPQSSFDPSFWERLYDLKLNVLKLDSAEQLICGFVNCTDGKHHQSIEFNLNSHQRSESTPSIGGKLLNVNTVEEFRDYDKKSALKRAALKVLSSILSLSAVAEPSELLSFILLTYADLKAYRFTYWLGVPAIIPESTMFTSSPIRLLKGQVHENGCNVCTELYRTLLKKLESHQEDTETESIVQSVFALRFPTSTESDLQHSQSAIAGSLSEYHMQHIQHAELLSLAEAWAGRHSASVYIVVADPSAAASGFGWIVRNLLAMLAIHVPTSAESPCSCRIIGLRGATAQKILTALSSPGSMSSVTAGHLLSLSEEDILRGDESVVATFEIDAETLRPLVDQACAALGVPNVASLSAPASDKKELEVEGHLAEALRDNKLSALNVVGWETNERGKPGPRVADLSQALDSRYLMAQAVDLNLRLMKWRLWPSLDTDRLASTKCLLLGAGTLGCAVARALLGWGVRDITLVDSGRVSYSNPARQCLFEFEDCELRSFKAVAAAARLRRIFPGVRSEGVVLSIPMPGHPLHSTAEVVEGGAGDTISEDEAQYRKLDELIRSHDVCFALTDSREARWLPTVMCAAYGKLLINAALGFDTYLVMRHGQAATVPAAPTASAAAPAQPAEPRWGCYFCNDIVAATNSQRDRSLDQQCTVTRPGLSFIAAALCVELMVALMHRGDGDGEGGGADNEVQDTDGESGGAVIRAPTIPHQIRGSVAGFTQFTPHSPAFGSCTACSAPIVSAFQTRGFDFVAQACQDSHVLEEVSGIAKLMENVDVDDCVGSDDDF